MTTFISGIPRHCSGSEESFTGKPRIPLGASPWFLHHTTFGFGSTLICHSRHVSTYISIFQHVHAGVRLVMLYVSTYIPMDHSSCWPERWGALATVVLCTSWKPSESSDTSPCDSYSLSHAFDLLLTRDIAGRPAVEVTTPVPKAVRDGQKRKHHICPEVPNQHNTHRS